MIPYPLEHNMWSYCFFYRYLIEKSKEDFTGQESFVWAMLQKNNLNFLPLGKAICLEKLDSTTHDHNLVNS